MGNVILSDATMNKEIFRVAPDGRVELGKDLSLDALKSLDMHYLLALREMVNTAIYDKKHGEM